MTMIENKIHPTEKTLLKHSTNNVYIVLWKAVIYRIFALLITFCISFYVVRDATESTLIACLVEFIQFLFYIGFEIVWEKCL